MQFLILVACGTFFLLSVLFLVLYLKMKQKWLETNSGVKKAESDLKIMTEKYKCAAEDLKPKKIGFYYFFTNIISEDDKKAGLTGEPYKSIIYVQELDRYNNGMSKIELKNVEVISGYDRFQYEWIKNSIRNRFCSLRKTSEIEWLESEEDIKELRKQKLEKIKNLGNEQI